MVTQKLGQPLGTSLHKARGKRAQGWRSQSSLTALKTNLTAIQQLYQLTYAAELNNSPLSKKIDRAIQDYRLTLAQIKLPLEQAVSDKAPRKQVEKLQQNLALLQQLIARELTAALGLSNSLKKSHISSSKNSHWDNHLITIQGVI